MLSLGYRQFLRLDPRNAQDSLRAGAGCFLETERARGSGRCTCAKPCDSLQRWRRRRTREGSFALKRSDPETAAALDRGSASDEAGRAARALQPRARRRGARRCSERRSVSTSKSSLSTPRATKSSSTSGSYEVRQGDRAGSTGRVPAEHRDQSGVRGGTLSF